LVQRPKPNSQSSRWKYDDRVGTTVGSGDGRRMVRPVGTEDIELLTRMAYSSSDLPHPAQLRTNVALHSVDVDPADEAYVGW
jgi:hypothetical protein